MGFPSKNYWSGLPFPSPRSLSDPEIEPMYPACRWILYHWAIREAPNGTLYSNSIPGGASGSEQRGCPSGLWTGGRKGQMEGQGSCAVQRRGGGGSRGGSRKCTVSWARPLSLSSQFSSFATPKLCGRCPACPPLEWLFHLLDVAVLCSIVCCPCPSPVPHVCAPTEVYAPCPSPH